MERTRIHKDNKGSALVMVMVAIALIGLLASVLMFVTYTGYQMRLTDRHGKNNFYTAEAVLDEINVGLQGDISQALGIAYDDLMRNYGLYETPEMRKNYLYNTYFARLQELLTPSGSTAGEMVYDITKLRSYLTAEICGDGAYADGSLDNFGTYGAIVESASSSGVYALVLSESGMVLKDLKVTYVDETGFVSMITTDIKIVLPSVSFDQSLAMPDLEKYATIADEGLVVYNRKAGGSVEIFGDVYAGKIDLGLEGGAVASSLSFKKPAGEERFSRVVSKETIKVGGQMRLGTDEIELWCKDIQMDGVSLTLDGVTNVADDLTVGGSGSTLTVSGEYYGYGVYTTEFDQNEKLASGLDETLSSAIVINGQNTQIDLSGAETLFLGGHAYISTAYDGNDLTAIESNNKNNVLMGESLAVKSNQLVYLIPPECLGCEIDSAGVTRNSKYFRNPMTLEQYQDIFVDNRDQYAQVDVNRPVAGLGGKTLADYLIPEPVAGSDVLQYVPEAVFKRTAGGTLVYCYMRFKDAEAANAYFRDYYGANAESVEKYTRLYANEIQVKDPDSMTSYYLAGNILTYDDSAEGTGSVIEATDSYGRRRQAESSANTKAEQFRALNIKLVTNPAQLRMIELDRNDVFDNIIDTDKMDEMINAFGGGGTAQITTPDGTLTAVLSRVDYEINNATPDNISMVICDGNVTVSADFQGLIIASGKVTVWDDTDMDATVVLRPISQENFTTLMGTKREEGDKTYIVLDVFRDGVNYSFTSGAALDVGTREVNLADLIRYENWSKK